MAAQIGDAPLTARRRHDSRTRACRPFGFSEHLFSLFDLDGAGRIALPMDGWSGMRAEFLLLSPLRIPIETALIIVTFWCSRTQGDLPACEALSYVFIDRGIPACQNHDTTY